MAFIKTWFIIDLWEMTVIIVISLGFGILNVVVTGEERRFSRLLLPCSNSLQPVTTLSSQADSPCPLSVRRPRVASRQLTDAAPLSAAQSPDLEPSWTPPPLGAGLCSAAPRPSRISSWCWDTWAFPQDLNIYSICSVNAVYKL